MKHEQKFYWLDLIRGVSALAVFSGHLRIVFFKDIPMHELPLLGKMFIVLTGFSHEAVMIFFVLSGFFIIKSVHEQTLSHRWSFMNYGINRVTRLWAVLIPALLIGLLIDSTGLHFFPDALSYTNQIRYFTGLNVPDKLGPEIFFGNVFFLQELAVPAYGSNGSLWSLANEFWYYTVFPLLYFSMSSFYKPALRIVFGLAGVGILFLVGQKMSLYFLIWLMGGVSYWLFTKRPAVLFQSRWLLLLLSAFFFVALIMVRLKKFPLFFNDYTVGIVFATIVPALTAYSMKQGLLKKVAGYLSDVSYSLYCVHLPFIFLLTAFADCQAMSWSNKHLLLYLLLAGVILLYATAMWYLFERNTPHFKKWVSRILVTTQLKQHPSRNEKEVK
jgi:peptidoglycan/LPS O-acetylase OafA/YrhL